MDKNEIELKIKSLYNECLQLEQKIEANKTKINSYMQKFVVGYQIGSGVYNDDYPSGYDIDISGDIEDYKEAVRLINSDIDDIDSLLAKQKEIKELIKEIPLTNELLDISSKSLELAQRMYQEKEKRLSILEQLKRIYSTLEEQEAEMKNNNSNVGNNNNSSGPSSSSSNSGNPSSNSNSSNSSNNNSSNNNNNSTTNNQSNFEDANYPQLINYNLAGDTVGDTKQNLAQHAENVKSLLSNVSINGEIVGGDVYGVTGGNTDSDVGFNFGALQLACDAVNADVNAIAAFIVQMQNKIASNKAAIKTKTAEMNKTEYYVDENGVRQTRFVHSAGERASMQAEIDAMEAENTQLEADIVSYTTEKENKQEVYNQLNNYRNAYNKAYPGLLNTFAANDLINTLSKEGPDSNLFGMSLTDTQKAELFNNLGSSLLNDQANLTLSLGDNFNLMNGEYPVGAFQYLLGACSIMGGTDKSFGENFTTFKEYQQSIAATLDYNEDTDKDASSNTDTKNSNQLQTGTTNSSGKLLGVNGRPISNKTLNPVVEQFMLDNAGNVVSLSKEFKQALDLQCDALLSIPKDYTTSEEWPLLMWLGGTGTLGGSVNNLKTSTFIKSVVNGSYVVDEAILYAPCQAGSGSSEGNNSKYDATKLDHDFKNIINGLNVDDNHISGFGISIGGFALASLVDSNPDTFASVAFCGGGFEGPWYNSIKIENAIANSPNTTYIFYNAENDETSKGGTGGGVHNTSLIDHQKLLDAGINSVCYEITGTVWHKSVERFATDALVKDLIHIEKGQKYSVPSEVQRLTPDQSVASSIDAGGTVNDWYISLASSPTTTRTTNGRYTAANPITQSESIPDVFKNINGSIPDINTIEKATEILRNVAAPRYRNVQENIFSADRSGLNPYYVKDNYVVYSQIGSKDENGNFLWNGWDNLYDQKRLAGEYTSNWDKGITKSGCSIASAAMVVSNLTNQNVTPDYVKTLYSSPTSNIDYNFAQDVFDLYNLDYARGISIRKTDETGTYYYDNVLKNGGAIINTVNEGGHYLAILGVDDSGGTKKYYVADPLMTDPGVWMEETSPEFAAIKNGYKESSMVIAPPGMDINQALAAPGTTNPTQRVDENHMYQA